MCIRVAVRLQFEQIILKITFMLYAYFSWLLFTQHLSCNYLKSPKIMEERLPLFKHPLPIHIHHGDDSFAAQMADASSDVQATCI